MHSRFHAALSNQLSAHNPNSIRLQSQCVKHCFWHKSSPVEDRVSVSYLSTRLSCLLGRPSLHRTGERHVLLKSDFLQHHVDIPRVQAALSEECVIMAGCHLGSIKTALSGWTSLSSGVLLVSHAASWCQSQRSGARSLPGRRRICRVLNTLLAVVDQSVLSNQAWVPQYCCMCRKHVWGEQSSFSSRITGPVLLKSHILPIPHFCGRAWRGDSSNSSVQCLVLYLPNQFSFFLTCCMFKECVSYNP